MIRQEPLPSRALESIDAHGGLDRWHAIDEIVVSASAGGASFSAKDQGKAIRNVQGRFSTGRQRAVLAPNPEPGKCGVFEEGTVRIESDGGEVLEERVDARSAFRGFRHQLWWDKLDMLYSCGYALWIYLTVPFTLAQPGFEVLELEPWEEGGETWQRIGVWFPNEIHTHCREQVLYFDQRGLVRRHDYTSEVFGSWAKARFLPPDDPQAPGHWALPRDAWSELGMRVEGAGTMEVSRAAIAEMPASLRQVIVLREEVRGSLSLDPEEERDRLHRARGVARGWSAISSGRASAMRPDGPAVDDVRCIELVELLTAYLDDELANEQRGRVDAHLSGCQGCRAALDQFRTLIRIASRLTTADVAGFDPLIRDRLMSTLQIPRRR